MGTLSNLRVWGLDHIEPDTLLQAQKSARLPIVPSPVALMPDAHVGMGATVGSVIPTEGAVIPAAVGVDIGCGMIAPKLPLRLPISLTTSNRLSTGSPGPSPPASDGAMIEVVPATPIARGPSMQLAGSPTTLTRCRTILPARLTTNWAPLGRATTSWRSVWTDPIPCGWSCTPAPVA